MCNISLTLWGIVTWLTDVTASTTVDENSCTHNVKFDGANLVFDIGALLMNDGDLCTHMSTA